MKILLNKNIASVLAFAVLTVPAVAFGAGLIPCGQPDGSLSVTVGNTLYPTAHPCGFDDLIILANIIIHFLMYSVAVPLAALGFMYSGAKLVLNQDKESAWSETKESFWNIAMGFAIMLGSYVLIKVILFNLLKTDAGFTSFLVG